MQSLNITVTERELTTLLDVLDYAMDNKDMDRQSVIKLFDRLSEMAYSMWDEEEA